jgi:hypothetical protein
MVHSARLIAYVPVLDMLVSCGPGLPPKASKGIDNVIHKVTQLSWDFASEVCAFPKRAHLPRAPRSATISNREVFTRPVLPAN